MRLHVKLFASVREAVGSRELEMQLPAGAVVADLLADLQAKYPGVGPGIEAGMVAVNQEYVNVETILNDGDEVAIIPPVSGGAGVGSELWSR